MRCGCVPLGHDPRRYGDGGGHPGGGKLLDERDGLLRQMQYLLRDRSKRQAPDRTEAACPHDDGFALQAGAVRAMLAAISPAYYLHEYPALILLKV